MSSLLDLLKTSRLSTRPVSDEFGFDRGQPVDRYYIEKFLSIHQNCITGDIIEVGGKDYSLNYGNQVNTSKVLHYSTESGHEIIADLALPHSVEEGIADCFIIPQTYQFIYDAQSAIANSIRLVKPGGTILATVPGITPISVEDYESWGQYWSFTEMSIRRLFEGAGELSELEVITYGNIKSAAAFLYGYASHELSRKDLDSYDMRYPVIIGVKAVK